MGNSVVEDEDLAKVGVAGRKIRRQRLSRARLARLLGEKLEAEDDDTGEEGDDEGVRLVRFLIGSRLRRRRRAKRMLLAHLLRERDEVEAEDESDEEADEGDDESRLVRALIGSRMLRRKRAKRMLLAHLLRERSEAEGEEDELDEGSGEDEDDADTQLVRLVIGSRILRGRRAKRMLLTHLLRERADEAA
jgi:hypothetical protein